MMGVPAIKRFRDRPIRTALLLCASTFGCGSPSGDAPDLDDPQEMSEPQFGGQSGVEGGCGFVVGGGMAWAATEELPELGVTPAQIAELVEGSHPLELRWQPWWEAPGPSERGVESLTLEVQWLGTTRVQPCVTELDMEVRLHDASGMVIAEAPAVLRPDRGPPTAPLELDLSAEFDDSALADHLALPVPPADGADTRTFKLSAAARDGAWTSILLSEVRGEDSCTLLTLPAQTRPCDRYAHSLPGPAQESSLTDVVGDGFRARDAIAVFDRLGPLEIRFADATLSSAQIDLTPAEYVCSTRYQVPNQPATIGTVVLIPADIRLRSADGRLDVTLDAQVTTFVSDAAGWNGDAGLYGMLTPLASLEASGSTVDLELPAGELQVLSLVLDAPAMEGASLQLEGYPLDPGVPTFPDVAESGTDRLYCFGDNEPTGRVELGIRTTP